MTPAAFRKLALSLAGATEGAHLAYSAETGRDAAAVARFVHSPR